VLSNDARIEPAEHLSAAEQRFDRARRTSGFVIAPLLAVLVRALPLELPAPAHNLAAIVSAVVVLWICESVPMPVTAILGPVAAIVCGIAPAREALAPFADPIIFLFIGGFMIARAMFVHGLDRRIAYTALSSRHVGASAARVLVTYGLVTAALSGWISNTATTAMMFPIGLAIAGHVKGAGAQADAFRRFALALMLINAFGASIGGLATPVGTPPNLIGIGLIEQTLGREIDFFQWMLLGVPVVVALQAFVSVMFVQSGTRGITSLGAGVETVRRERAALGPMTAGERNVLIAFAVTVSLWVLPGLLAIAGLSTTPFARAFEVSVPEGVAAMLGAILLFVLPVDWSARRFTLAWDQASRIDWGIVLLYGGGLSLGSLMFSTGLAKAFGEAVTAWYPSPTTFSLTVAFTGIAILLSETTSNTTSANMLVPIAIAVSQAAGVDPLAPALAATLGASMGFMMPISTPPNAIAYGSGLIPLTAMMRFGIALDLVGFVVIVTAVNLLVPILF
jgi:solute carrier family 13 (sodium-dependent dicarboxylate transporter), member 2/3/5